MQNTMMKEKGTGWVGVEEEGGKAWMGTFCKGNLTYPPEKEKSLNI